MSTTIPKTMRAIRLHPAPPNQPPYSGTNPAPSSALFVNPNIPLPSPSTLSPSELLVRIHATTVTRGSLNWPELYNEAEMGNDFSGVVAAVHPDATEGNRTGLEVGDAVYGMTNAGKGGAWAEFVVVGPEEVFRLPESLRGKWAEAASLPMSVMTAEQAVFEKAGLEDLATAAGVGQAAGRRKKVLVTGASGAVGMFVVRFAVMAGHEVVACARGVDEEKRGVLRGYGAKEVRGYEELRDMEEGCVDAVIDTVGGRVLEECWRVMKARGGALISIETDSWDFVERHARAGVEGSEKVKGQEFKAFFFILEPSRRSMAHASELIERGGMGGSVAATFKFEEAQAAYDLAESGKARGKIVLIP